MSGRQKTTLGRELLLVIIAALCISIFAYFALDVVFDSYLDKKFKTDEYYNAEDQKIISSLEDYIKEYSVSSDDWYILNKWADANPVSSITVYKEGRLTYMSGQASRQEKEKLRHETTYEQKMAYDVDFKDGECDVIIYGKYAAFYYDLAGFIKIAVPFLIFIFILLYVVKRKLSYISRIVSDIHILEEDREHRIHLEGRDELTTLAESIDDMSQAYNEKLEYINKMYDESREFVTEMSHDMRTPMTPLMVYLNMLRDKKYNSEEEHDSYIEKANEKAVELNHMSDNMFASLLMNQPDEIEKTAASMNMAFYDQISALVDYLTTEGFKADTSVDMKDVYVAVNEDFISRIFNNIASNFMKYADIRSPVHISMYTDRNMVVLRFMNIINALADYSFSTGFGVKNIRKMMTQMGAGCDINQQLDTYTTVLTFPIVDPPDGTSEEDPEEA